MCFMTKLTHRSVKPVTLLWFLVGTCVFHTMTACVLKTAASLCVLNLFGHSASNCRPTAPLVLAWFLITDVNGTLLGALILFPRVHLLSALALFTGDCTMAPPWVCGAVAFVGNESALNRNIAAFLFSFHSLFIILLARPIQGWPDKSAAQWAVRWRGSFGVWMALAVWCFTELRLLFSVV